MIITQDLLMERLLKEKKVANDFQLRRHEQWDDNYTLYRNKVKTNRLTQRQAVNIPLMKETVKTLLSKIDEPPSAEWKEKNGMKEKEIILQEMWNTDFDELNFEGVDMQDKKTVLLYGRGFKKLNFADSFSIDAMDIYDIVLDPLTNPINIETARFVIHQNIFRSLREVLASDRYDSKAKQKLKTYLTTKDATLQSAENVKEMKEKNERLLTMGVENTDFDKFSAGDTIVNITEHFTNTWDVKRKMFIRYVYVYAFDNVLLLETPLKDLIGVDFYPFVMWGEDMETQDIWSDGPADLVRTPNKVLNVWFSQMIENRTLKNFQMHWYDSSLKGFQPQTYEPGPGRMLPAYGDPNKTIRPVDVSGLDDTMAQIEFLIKLVESGSAATATEKGTGEKKQITLGEVQLLVGKAMERTLSMAKFYQRSWRELATKWYQMKEANEYGKKTLYKISSKGKIWPLAVFPKDWKSKEGFQAIIRSSSEQEEKNVKGIQKITLVKNQFPDNPALNKILQKRMLELIDLTPQEMREIEEFEKKKLEMPPVMPVGGEQPPQPSPEVERLGRSVGELKQLVTQ